MMKKDGISEADLKALNKAMNSTLAAQKSAGIPPVASTGAMTASTKADSSSEKSTPREGRMAIGHEAVASLQPDYIGSWEKFAAAGGWEKEFSSKEGDRAHSTFRVIGGGY